MSGAPLDEPPLRQTVAFKIIAADEWPGIAASGAYGGSAVDLADGYVHLSTDTQFAETAAKHYAGRAGLMSLTVDLATLGKTVVWEPSRGGQLFPHIFGPLPVTAVTSEGRGWCRRATRIPRPMSQQRRRVGSRTWTDPPRRSHGQLDGGLPRRPRRL